MKNSIIEITSASNDRIKYLKKFRQKNGKIDDNLILIEGEREIERALKKGIVFKEIYFTRELLSGTGEKLLDELLDLNVNSFSLKKGLFESIAYKNNPFGSLVLAQFQPMKIEDLKLSEKSVVLVCEGIEKPGNLGALMRTADGAGVDAVIALDCPIDYRNPNLLRSSTGTLFSMQYVECGKKELVDILKKYKLRLLCASPFAKEIYYNTNLKSGFALVVGSEDKGLTKEIEQLADVMVSIPMKGYADSLNVHQSATVILYESLRQREQL